MWQRLLACLVVSMLFGNNAIAGTYPPNGEIVLTNFPVIPDGILLAGKDKQYIGSARLTATTLAHTVKQLTVNLLDERGAFVASANPINKVRMEYYGSRGQLVVSTVYVDRTGKASFFWQSIPVPTGGNYVDVKFYVYVAPVVSDAQGAVVSPSGRQVRFRLSQTEFQAVGVYSTITQLRTNGIVSRLFTVREGKPVFAGPSYTYRTLTNGYNEIFHFTVTAQTSALNKDVSLAEIGFFVDASIGLILPEFDLVRVADGVAVGTVFIEDKYVRIVMDPAVVVKNNQVPIEYSVGAVVSSAVRGSTITTYPSTLLWSDGVSANILQWDVAFYGAPNWQRLSAPY